LEETTMLLWDPDLSMHPNDLFEVQEPPAEVLVVQTKSKGQSVSNDLITIQSLREKKIVYHLKSPFVSQINPINIHTQESPKMDYNIVEELKKLKVNVSIMYICIIPQQKDFPLHSLRSIEAPITSVDLGEVPSPTNLKNKPNVNAFSFPFNI